MLVGGRPHLIHLLHCRLHMASREHAGSMLCSHVLLPKSSAGVQLDVGQVCACWGVIGRVGQTQTLSEWALIATFHLHQPRSGSSSALKCILPWWTDFRWF